MTQKRSKFLTSDVNVTLHPQTNDLLAKVNVLTDDLNQKKLQRLTHSLQPWRIFQESALRFETSPSLSVKAVSAGEKQ